MDMLSHLLSIEFSKLKRLTALKVLVIIYMVMTPAWMFFLFHLFETIIASVFPPQRDPLAFPHIWNTATYTASFFNILMGIIIVIIVSNDYTYRTLKQNVIDGLTKTQVIVSKFMVVVLLAVFVTAYTSLMALVVGLIYGNTDEMGGNIHYIFLYFLQALGYFSFAFFFTILVRRSALSIIFFVVSFIVEWIIGVVVSIAIDPKVYLYFPLNVMSKLTPNPLTAEFNQLGKMQNPPAPPNPELDMSTNIMLSVMVMAIFFGISYWVLRRRDL